MAKLNVSSSSLDYATFIGGNNFDRGFSLAIDGTGNVYISGVTGSSNFPTTPGAFDTTFDGLYEDGFVVKLNPTGSNLVYAAFRWDWIMIKAVILLSMKWVMPTL
ncbi:MAG: hypothetical protein IPL78_32755 [Chloroflexi bacterium]|nr:hypothetical protein [Chloroflexota bacterium]